jgi:hypothetical protein
MEGGVTLCTDTHAVHHRENLAGMKEIKQTCSLTKPLPLHMRVLFLLAWPERRGKGKKRRKKKTLLGWPRPRDGRPATYFEPVIDGQPAAALPELVSIAFLSCTTLFVQRTEGSINSATACCAKVIYRRTF